MTRCERAVAYVKYSAEINEEYPGIANVTLSQDDPNAPVMRSIYGGLFCLYAVDAGDQLELVQQRDLELEKLSEEQLHYLAVGNLADIAHKNLKIDQHGDVFTVTLDGNFEASLLVIDGLWDKGLRHLVKNDFVACIPARDVLAFCDSSSQAGIQTLRKIVSRTFAGGDHLLTRLLYVRKENQWTSIGV